MNEAKSFLKFEMRERGRREHGEGGAGLGGGFGRNAGEWTGRVEISKEEIPGSKRNMYGYILTYSRH